VPIGAADIVKDKVSQILSNLKKNIEFDVVFNPEFLKEGEAINDFMEPDRIIIGTDSPRAVKLLRALYSPFGRNHDRLINMDISSAELTKYAANAMLATKISFMNELSNLAERLGADIDQVRNGIGSDRRIGYSFIYPGCGYGGSCLPKDISALRKMAKDIGFNTQLLNAVQDVNDRQKSVLFSKIKLHFKNNLLGKTIGLWGLAFKPNTDDMREAPSRVLMGLLWNAGCKVQAYDPVAMDKARRIYGQRADLILTESPEDAAEHADALVLVTEWRIFQSPDFHRIKKLLNSPILFDGRNIFDPMLLKNIGFIYYGMGRNS